MSETDNLCEFHGFNLNKETHAISLFGKPFAVHHKGTAILLETLILAKGELVLHKSMLEKLNGCLTSNNKKPVTEKNMRSHHIREVREKIAQHLTHHFGCEYKEICSMAYDVVGPVENAGYKLSREALEKLRTHPKISPSVS
jgi:DNA-binding response OmpR family regulator